MNIEDFIEIKDYYKKAGQSGKLGIAVHKSGKKYLLKRGEFGTPANEYVYSLVAKKIGVSCQTCHLVEGYDYPVVAIEFIEQMPAFRLKKFDVAAITDDIVRAYALDSVTWQDDCFQYVVDKNGKFFKIDNAEAFCYSEVTDRMLDMKGYAEDLLSDNGVAVERIVAYIRIVEKNVLEKYGKEKIAIFKDTLQRIIDTDFTFILGDVALKSVYSYKASRFFFGKIKVIRKAIATYFDGN